MTITSVNDGSSDKFYRAWADSADGSKGFSTTDSSKEYFGVYAGITPPSNYKAYSWTKIKGDSGRSVTDTEMEYAINDSKTTPPTSGWSLEMPVWKTGLFIWQRVKVSYSTGNPSYTTPHCLESNIIDDVTGNIGDWIFRDKTEILSGTEIFTDKADEEALVHVEVDGKSYQHAGSGKNLLNPDELRDYLIREGAGVELVDNGIRVVNFKENLTNMKPLLRGRFKENTIYTVSFRTKKMLGNTLYVRACYTDGSTSNLFTNANLDSYITNYGVTASGKTVDFLYFSFGTGGFETRIALEDAQVVEGVDVVEYEPPAPSPDYPIEIHSLNDFDVVSSPYSGKNLARMVENHHSNGGSITTTKIITTNDSTKRKRYLAKVTPGQTYTWSRALVDGEGPRLFYFKNNPILNPDEVSIGGHYQAITQASATVTIPEGANWFYYQISTAEDAKLQLEKGSVATAYEPAPSIDAPYDTNSGILYKTNLLLDEPLRSVGDVKDRLFRDSDGLWKIERNVGEYTTDGTDTWSPGASSGGWNVSGSTSPFYSSTLLNKMKPARNKNAITNRFTVGAATTSIVGNDKEEFSLGYASWGVIFRIEKNRLATDDGAGFRNWIANNPVTIIYELANPVIETLHQALQDKLNNLRSFKDSNYVYTVMPDKSNILSENLKPTLHATFKSIAWANDFRYKFEQSKAMHATDIWFAKGVSNTIAPNIGWSTDAPVWEDGLYIWSKTITTYGDGRTEETSPVCITGATGRSVDKIEEWYYLSNKSNSLEGGTWSKTPPTWTDGKYIWTKNKIIYKNPSGSEETAPINNTGGSGQKGETGTDARTVRLNNVIHAVHFDQDGLMPSVTSIAFPTVVQGFSGVTPYYEFKMGNTIVRGLSTDSSWTLNTSAMKYSDFPLAVTVNVVIGGQTLATDTVTIVGTKPGEDAYTVVLANESHTFVGDVSNAMAGNTTANIIAYRGGTQVGATIGTISGLPTGMTSTVYSNGTTSARVTFTVTTSMTSPNGVVNIPVTVNGKSFTKVFNYAIAFKGAKGDKGTDGVAGKDGVGIRTTVLAYASSTSGTTTPTSGWTTTVPTVAPGNYLWTRTTWNYSDNSSENGYTVSRIGKDGNTGANGIAGKDGVGIKSTVIHYGGSTSGTSHSGVAWTTAIPSVSNGQFLWTRTTWTYDDNTTETGYSVAKMGETGAKGDKGDKGDRGTDGIAGKDGVGIKTTTLNYVSSTNGTTAPTSGWTTTIPTVAAGNYLWTRTIWTYTDNSTETGYSVSRIGKDGNTGANGIAGKDGVGLTSTTITYAASTSGTTAPTSGWATTVPTVAVGSFLWTRTVWAYTDGTSETGYSVGKMGDTGPTGATGATGAKGATGERGPQGATGVSVQSITEYYLATSASSGVTTSTSGWVTTMPTMTTTNKYLWNYEKVNFSDGTNQPTIPVIIGVHGATGATGGTGATGRSITGITEHYLATASASGVTRTTSGWSTTMQSTTTTNKYLWNYETITWNSAPLTTYVEPIIIGVHGATGSTGATGAKGNPGENATARNFLLDSKPSSPITNSSYPIASFLLAEKPVVGETYTITIKGQLAATKTAFYAYNSGGSISVASNIVDQGNGLYYKSFNWINSYSSGVTANDTSVVIYPFTSSQSGTSTIEWVSLVKGSVPLTEWVPAHEDLQKGIDELENAVNNTSPTGENLIVNGGFENSKGHQAYGWSPSYELDSVGHSGSKALIWRANPVTQTMSHVAMVPVEPGRTYEYGYWACSSADANGVNGNNKMRLGHSNGSYLSDLGITGAVNNDTSWVRYAKEYTIPNDVHEVKISLHSNNTIGWYKIDDVFMYDITDRKSIEGKADGSATESALNEAAAKLQVLQQEIEAAATSNELKDFIDKYNKDMASRDKDARESESSLSSALASIDAIQTNMGDMSATWQFIDRFIKNTPQGIVVGNDSSGSYILIKEDRLSFYSNGQEVAFISQNLMEISRGAFVEQIQIAKYQFEESTTNHLTIRYVG